MIVEAHLTEDHPQFGRWIEVMKSPSVLGVVTIADSLAQVFRGAGVDGDKILVWPDAVDPSEFGRQPSKADARARVALTPDEPIVMYVGQMYPGKGADLLVEVGKILPDVRIVLVGGRGDDLARVQQLARRSSNVEVRGSVPRSEVPTYLAAADVLALPTNSIAVKTSWLSPLKLFEYMGSHRPIVSTDLAFVRSILHPDNSTLVEADRPEAFAEGIREVLDNPVRGEQRAARAAADVLAYTWEARVRAILERFI